MIAWKGTDNCNVPSHCPGGQKSGSGIAGPTPRCQQGRCCLQRILEIIGSLPLPASGGWQSSALWSLPSGHPLVYPCQISLWLLHRMTLVITFRDHRITQGNLEDLTESGSGSSNSDLHLPYLLPPIRVAIVFICRCPSYRLTPICLASPILFYFASSNSCGLRSQVSKIC